MIPRAIAITGATGGLGRALVRAFATPGRALLVVGRDADRLAAAETDARERGADVVAACLDIRDRAAFRRALSAFAADHGLGLLVVNAGVKAGNEAGREAPGQADRVLAVNLAEPVAQVEAALPYLRDEGGGRIVLVSSIAAMAPSGDLLSYSASKAGLRAYGTALRRALAGSGIGVTLVTPGFVDTPMTERQLGPAPFRVSADDAALAIRTGVLREAALVTFPWQLAVLVRLMNLLPPGMADRIAARFRAEILPDTDERSAPG